MSVGLVLDPRPVPRVRGEVGETVATARIGSLAGKVVGFRIDESWQSWNWIAGDWARELELAGAEIVMWRSGKPVGELGVKRQQEFEEFIEKVEFAIVGLCNCGGCTMQTVKDTMALLDSGVPAITVAAEHFQLLARNLSTGAGWPDLRIKTLPFPLETLPEENIHKISGEQYEDLLELMGVDR